MGDFLEDGHVSGEQAAAIRAEISKLLAELRPDAAALVDAFALDDYFLNSALGASDGDVYRRLYEEVQEAPFNKSHVPPGYADLLHGRLVKERGEVEALRVGDRAGEDARRDAIEEIRNEHWMIETRARVACSRFAMGLLVLQKLRGPP